MLQRKELGPKKYGLAERCSSGEYFGAPLLFLSLFTCHQIFGGGPFSFNSSEFSVSQLFFNFSWLIG